MKSNAKRFLSLLLALCVFCALTGATSIDDEFFVDEDVFNDSLDGVVFEGEGVEEVEIITIEDDEAPLMRFFDGIANSLNNALFKKNNAKSEDAGNGAPSATATKSGNDITVKVGAVSQTFKNAWKKNGSATYELGEYEVKLTYNGNGIKSVATVKWPAAPSSSSEPSSSEPSSSEPSSSEASSSEPSSSEPSSSEPSSSEPSSSEPSSSEPSSSEPSSSEPSSSEPSQPEVPEATFATVADLRNGSGYAAGDTVTTAGFYAAGDGGGADYIVGTKTASEPLVIPMAGGLTAELAVKEEMSVLQFGAVNDGSTDSQPALQAALDSTASTLTFPQGGKLMVRSDLQARTSKTIKGNNCTLFTDNGYAGSDEMFVRIVRVDGLEWNNLNITALQTKTLSFVTQIGVQDSSNIDILNSALTGPEAVYKEDGTAEFAMFSNIDLWTGWNNVTVDGCTLVLTHDGPEGCSIMARDIQNRGVLSGFRFTNNNVYKICDDEMFALAGEGDQLRDIYVSGNTFYARDGKLSSSDFSFSFGGKSAIDVSDLVFENNNVDVQTALCMIYTNASGSNVVIRDNDIQYMRGKGENNSGASKSQGGYVIYQNLDVSRAALVEIIDNTIAVDNTGGQYRVNSVFLGKYDIRGNDVTIKGYIPTVFSRPYNAENNYIKVQEDPVHNDAGIGAIINGGINFSNNTVDVDGTINIVYRCDNAEFETSFTMSENTITSSKSSNNPSYVILASNITLNNNRIELHKNIINFPTRNDRRSDFRYNINALDEGGAERIYTDGLSLEDFEEAVYGPAGVISPMRIPTGTLAIPSVNVSLSEAEEVPETPSDTPSSGEAPPAEGSSSSPSGSVPPVEESSAPPPSESVPPAEESTPFDVSDYDISDLQNVVFFSPDNYLSDSLTNTYLDGGVKVISPRQLSGTNIGDDDPALSEIPGFFTGTMVAIATIFILVAIAGVILRVCLKRRASKS